jgi:hypothetical protein
MKSMLVADMAVCIVAGLDWLPGCMGGGQGIEVEKGAVLWLDMDNGKKRTDARIDALCKARKMDIDSPVYYLSMPVPSLLLNDIDALIALVELGRDDLHISTIIIDNLGLITGDVEENSAGMAQVMGYMRILAERTEAAVILIHHQRKGGAAGGRAGDALRGHSSIEAAVDLALQIVREPGEQEIVIQSTKTRGVDVPTVRARFNYEHKTGTNDLAVAWFDGVEGARGENPVRMVILDVLADYPQGITKGRLVDIVQKEMGGDVGVNRIRNWVADMVGVTGEIEERTGNNNAKILVLNDAL